MSTNIIKMSRTPFCNSKSFKVYKTITKRDDGWLSIIKK